MTETLENIARNTKPIFEKYGIKYAGVFGSYARGDARSDSDVDILIETPKPITLFTFFDMNDELEKTLRKKVDVLTKRSLNKRIRPFVMADLKVIYENK